MIDKLEKLIRVVSEIVFNYQYIEMCRKYYGIDDGVTIKDIIVAMEKHSDTVRANLRAKGGDKDDDPYSEWTRQVKTNCKPPGRYETRSTEEGGIKWVN